MSDLAISINYFITDLLPTIIFQIFMVATLIRAGFRFMENERNV